MTTDLQQREAGSEASREQRILAIVFAAGTEIYPSKLNAGRVVVVNGLTGLDACERSAEDCFDILLREEDGGHSPPRLAIGFDLSTGLPSMKVETGPRIAHPRTA